MTLRGAGLERALGGEEDVAPISADALQQTGIDRAELRPWYSFALELIRDENLVFLLGFRLQNLVILD